MNSASATRSIPESLPICHQREDQDLIHDENVSSPNLFRFLISGKSGNNSRKLMLEEINYFDGDASAVAADLTNNVDVNTFFDRVTEYGDFFKFSDILSRSE